MRSAITIKGRFIAKKSFTVEVTLKIGVKSKKLSEKAKNNTKGEITRV